MIVVNQPPARESTVVVINNASNGVTAASGSALTFRFNATNSNASPSTSGGTSYTIVWGDGSANTTSATSSVAAGVVASTSPTHTYAVLGTYTGRIDTTTNDLYSVKGSTTFKVIVAS